MPKIKRIGKGKTGRFNIRLDNDTADFYRSEANNHGLDVSEFFRQLLMRGVIASSVREIQEDLKCTAAEIRENWNDRDHAIPDEITLSLFTCEELLKLIVGTRDIQKLYEAQNTAQVKLKQLKSKNHKNVA